jgi:acyl carrier protein
MPSDVLGALRALPPLERRERLERHLREQVGLVLRLAADRIDAAAPLKELGVNSLMSLELRNRLEATLGVTLPATLVWNYPTVTAVAAHLEERLGLVAAAPPAVEAVDDPEIERLLAEIQDLSEDDVRRLLADGASGPRDE